MRKLKSYLVFTSVLYRVVMFVIVPLLLIGLGIYLSSGLSFPAEIFVMVFLPVIEVIADYMIFGGIASRKIEHLEYLKTSKRGMQMLKDALTGGMFRILLSEFLIVAIMHAATFKMAWQDIENSTILIISFFCSTYFFSMLGITVSRFLTVMQANWVVAYAASMLGAFAMVQCIRHPYVSLIVFIILSIVISILSIYIAMKRAEESYYDKAV